MEQFLLATRQAVEHLYRSLWSGAPLSDPEKIELIDQLGRTGGASVVPALLSLLFHDTGSVAAAAAGWIDQIVRAQSSLELARLDLAVRERGDWQWPNSSAEVVPRVAHGLTGTLGAIACHGSGYLREPAIHLLALAQDGAELPFLLIRLNDWVREVREAAKVALLDRLERADYAPHFARHVPLLFRLEYQGRDDYRAVTGPALRLLKRPECRPALFAVLEGPDRDAGRLAFGLLLDAGEGLEETVSRGLVVNDTVVRLRAARAARQRLESPALERVLARMIGDRFMPVRREALYGHLERLPASAAAVSRSALLDRHPSMREAARFCLRQLGETEFAEFYRVALDSRGGAPAVAGLGETGRRDDVARVQSCLADPDPRVRREAVRALGRLDTDGDVEPFLAALEDPSARVANAASDILRPRLYLVRGQRLWSIVASTARSHARRAALALIDALPWWESAPLLVATAASADQAIARAALDYLERWRWNAHRLTVRPAPDQLASLEAMLREHRNRLGPAVIDDLEAHVAYAKRELM